MKITPITNNKNLSVKGCVSDNIIYGMNAYYRNFQRHIELAEANPVKYENLIKFWKSNTDYVSKFTNNIIKNMQIIMSRFGKSCVLDWHSSKKDPMKQLFVIESNNSVYKKICGEISLKNNPFQDLATIDKFTVNTLAEIDPYETNLKFKIMEKPNIIPDTFESENEFWFPNDKLVEARPGIISKSVKTKDDSETANILKNEKQLFNEEFEVYLNSMRG